MKKSVKRLIGALITLTIILTFTTSVFAGSLGSRNFFVNINQSSWINRNSECWDLPSDGNYTLRFDVLDYGSPCDVYFKQWQVVWNPQIAYYPYVRNFKAYHTLGKQAYYVEIWRREGESSGTVSLVERAI